MRRDELWNLRAGGYIEPLYPGYNILVRGSDRYVNFGVTVGETGYGFRDNAGTMQFKNNSGSWTDIGSGSGSGSGDVVGPSSATDENIPIFNETTGKTIKDSGKKLSDYVEDTFLFDSTAESAKNLCDENFIDRYAISTVSHAIEYSYGPNSFAVIVPIEADKTYTVTKYVGGNRFRIGLTSVYPTLDLLPMAPLYYYIGSSSSTRQSHTFTNTYGANYVIVVISSSSTSPANVQVEEGSTSTDYEVYNPSPSITKTIKPALINLPVNITNVQDFGAVGDGITDDTSSLELAFADGYTNKKPIFFPPGTYMIRRSLVLRDGMEVYGKEATLKKFAAVTTTTTEITPEGQEYVVVTDVTGFTIGSQMYIHNNSGARYATYGIITSIDVGNKRIYFTSSYNSIKTGAIQDHASGTKVSTSHALIRSWSTYWGCVGAYVHDLTLDGNRQASEANEWTNGCIHIDPVGSTINGITYTQPASNNTFRRLIVKNSPFDGISDQSTGGGIVENCYFYNSYKHGVHFGTIYVNGKVYGNTFDSMLGSGVFWCQQAENIVVTGNYFVDCYRGCSSVDYATPPINSVIANNFFRNITNVVLDFSNNTYNSTYGGMIIESNIVMGLNNNFVRANYLDSILISNNIIRTITTAPSYLIVAQNVNKLIVTNNMSVSNTDYLDSTGATSVIHANNIWN